MTGSPCVARNASRTCSGQVPPPVQTSVSDRRSRSVRRARSNSWAGAPFQTCTPSRPIHSATPSGSRRSITTVQPPACAVSTVDSTSMFKMVKGRLSPLRSSGPQPRVAISTAGGSTRLCWLCTTALGAPVVPLEKAIPAGACGSISTAGTGCRAAVSCAHRPASTTTPPSRAHFGPTRMTAGAITSARACCSTAVRASPIPAQTAPIRCAPWNATTISRSFGRQAATRSPGRTPSAQRAPAAASAAASSWA